MALKFYEKVNNTNNFKIGGVAITEAGAGAHMDQDEKDFFFSGGKIKEFAIKLKAKLSERLGWYQAKRVIRDILAASVGSKDVKETDIFKAVGINDLKPSAIDTFAAGDNALQTAVAAANGAGVHKNQVTIKSLCIVYIQILRWEEKMYEAIGNALVKIAPDFREGTDLNDFVAPVVEQVYADMKLIMNPRRGTSAFGKMAIVLAPWRHLLPKFMENSGY